MNIKYSLVLLASFVTPSLVLGDTLPERASEEFQDFLSGRSYEGDVLPEDANPGWNRLLGTGGGEPTVELGDGFLRFTGPAPSSYVAWRQDAIIDFGKSSLDRGWTVEIRARIPDPQELRGEIPAHLNYMQLDAYLADDAAGTYVLRVWDDVVEWQVTPSEVQEWPLDNSEEFNVFRVVKEPDAEVYQLFRNGEHIGVDLKGGVVPSAPRFLWGDWNTSRRGGADVEYVRWETGGAFVPPGTSWGGLPERPSESFSNVLGGMSYEGWTLPEAANPAWNVLKGTGGGEPEASVSDGILSFSAPAPNSYIAWRNDSILEDATISGGWTIEMKVRVHPAETAPPSDARLHLLFNKYLPNDSHGAYNLRIWNDLVEWAGPTALTWPMDNTKDFHDYRIVKEPNDGPYRLYRDGVMLADGLTGNGVPQDLRFLWGDWNTARQGGAEVDHIRWDLSGAYIPVAPVGATYEKWVGEYFSESEQGDPEVSGPDASPLGDGVPNLVKYALGLVPLEPVDRDRLPGSAVELLTVDGSEAEYLILELTRPVDRGDLNYIVEAGDKLVTWPDTAVLHATVENGDGTVTETYRDSVPVGTSDRRFIRLRVELSE